MATGRWLATALVAALAVAAAAAAAVPLSSNSNLPNVAVNIPGVGEVIGITNTTSNNERKVHYFLGIPFVKRPDRFEEPREFETWDEPLDVTEPAPSCPQGKFYPYELLEGGGEEDEQSSRRRRVWTATNGDGTTTPSSVEEVEDVEDCLTLDVYTPGSARLNASSSATRLLPVLLFFHGGAFVRGSSQNVKPDFLLDLEDERLLVIVSAQYRLGPLGFLAGGGRNESGRGNAGLHDQKWALKWTKEHVSAFGGDPSHIVIGGVSAGGATSGLLYTSPQTNDMIVGAILFSGCSVVPWTIDTEPRRSSRGIGRLAGCAEQADAADLADKEVQEGNAHPSEVLDAEDALVECLITVPVEELLNATWVWARNEKSENRVGMGGTIPVVDGEGGMVPRMPRDVLTDESFKSKAKPLLIGITREEGLYLHVQLDAFYIRYRNLHHNRELMTTGMGDILLRFSGIDDPLFVLGHMINTLYFREDQLGDYEAMEDGIIDFSGAGYFKAPAYYMAQLNAGFGQNTWLYSWDYVSVAERNFARSTDSKPRSNHGSDQSYLFPARNKSFTYAQQDIVMVERFSRTVADFVTTLDPTSRSEGRIEGAEWPPFTGDDHVYMGITENGWETRRNFPQEYHATNGRATGLAAPTAALSFVAVAVAALQLTHAPA